MRAPNFRRSLLAALLAGVLLLVGCATDKDAFLNRSFHRLTTRDNGWFNANEKLNELVLNIEDSYELDFDEVLPIFIYGTEDQARAAIPELEKCIEKCSIVIDRHSMEIKDKEKNTWIDDAWFVIGKSHFYKGSYYEAQRVFTYISRKYKGENRQVESKLWAARASIMLEQFSKAQTLLDEVKGEKELPKRFPHDELSAVQAELYLKRGKVDESMVHLEHAVGIARKKRDRVRWAFILAQLYQMKGQEEKAIRQYAAVVKMSPPYELGFHAQIFQALAFNKGDSKALRQKLNRMLRDEKHTDHFDMIHYALAEIDLKERNKPAAIEHLETSCRVSTTDIRQKAKSYLKLADLYFDDRMYSPAQKYYDSTSTVMREEHPRYDEVVLRAEVLGDLVEQLEIIAREDSLQALAREPAEVRERKIRQIIRERERAEEERERAEAEAREAMETAPSVGAKPSGGGGRGVWYFYDPQQVGRGAAEFRKRWGTRPLEDDWRRKDKAGSAKADFADMEDEDEEDGKEKGKDADGEPEWKDPDFYLRNLPLDEAAIAASDELICNALYRSGMIYKEQLKDMDNAIESFENLHSRFDECRYTPEAFYQLYRIYKEKEEVENYFALDGMGSEFYANIVLERFPTSEFARLIRDPNVLQADEARRLLEEAEYKLVYDKFRRHEYLQVIGTCNRVITEEQANHYRAKYYLLKAMAVGGMKSVDAFRNALNDVKTNAPGTDEAKAAEELLAALDKAEKQEAPKEETGKAIPTYKSEQGQHYFALVVPNAGNDMNQVKIRISDFNQSFFRNVNIQVTSSFLDNLHQVVLLSVFENRGKAMEYYDMFKKDKTALQGINDQGWIFFAISPDNYSQLYRNKDLEGYAQFFSKNYLERQ